VGEGVRLSSSLWLTHSRRRKIRPLVDDLETVPVRVLELEHGAGNPGHRSRSQTQSPAVQRRARFGRREQGKRIRVAQVEAWISSDRRAPAGGKRQLTQRKLAPIRASSRFSKRRGR